MVTHFGYPLFEYLVQLKHNRWLPAPGSNETSETPKGLCTHISVSDPASGNMFLGHVMLRTKERLLRITCQVNENVVLEAYLQPDIREPGMPLPVFLDLYGHNPAKQIFCSHKSMGFLLALTFNNVQVFLATRTSKSGY